MIVSQQLKALCVEKISFIGLASVDKIYFIGCYKNMFDFLTHPSYFQKSLVYVSPDVQILCLHPVMILNHKKKKMGNLHLCHVQ